MSVCMECIKEKWNALVAEDRPLGERLVLILASCGLLAFTLFCFAPINIYFQNSREFWFRFAQFWWIPVLVGAAAFLLTAGVGLLLRGKLLDLYITALFALAVVLYLQGNFLNISYGELNGEQVNWSRYGGYAIANFALTAVLFLIPFIILYFHKGFWRGMVRFVAFLLVSMQLVALVFAGIAYSKPEDRELALGWEGVSDYSGEQNLVLIVVDAFDEPYFAEYLAAHGEQRMALDGFTYYRNTAGISSTTFFSMTPMLTGHIFDYHPANYDAYLELAWNDATLFTKLQAAGYDVRVLSPQEIYIGRVRDDLFDNYIAGDHGIADYKKFTRMLYDLVLYTHLPHVFKAGFWIYPGEFNYLQDKRLFTDDDAEAFRHITESPIRAVAKNKTFRLYHLNAMHEPFTLTAAAGRLPGNAETTPLEQAEGTFLIVDTLLQQMREAGVYDNSTIIITADHANSAHYDEVSLTSPIYSPVLLYKPANAAGALETTDIPASLMDIRATFLSAAGLSYAEEGEPLIRPGEAREHAHLHYFYRSIGSPRTFYEYCIGNEDANNVANWRLTGRVFAPPSGGQVMPDAPDGE